MKCDDKVEMQKLERMWLHYRWRVPTALKFTVLRAYFQDWCDTIKKWILKKITICGLFHLHTWFEFIIQFTVTTNNEPGQLQEQIYTYLKNM